MVKILDTTLREGEQTPGVYFDSHVKLGIAKKLEEVGVQFIEAGHPVVSKEIFEAIKGIANAGLKPTIAAHSRSLQNDVDLALECGVGFLGIFYCVSDDRLNGVFKKDLKTAIDQITKVIKYAKEKNPNLIIRYTPEDTVRTEFENVIAAAIAAVEAGADVISIADTTGYMIPGTKRSMYNYVGKLKETFIKRNLNPQIAVHCHNDRGLALANSLDGYRAGADIIDATVLGLGERAGLTDLAELLAVLTTDFNENGWNLHKLPELYELVSRFSGFPIPANSSIIGKNAFTHCAGVHTQAAIQDPKHYQSLDPSIIGKKPVICLDHMSGIAAVRYSLEQLDATEIEDHVIDKVAEIVKLIGHRGRTVDSHELSLIYKWAKNGNSKKEIYHDGIVQ